MAPVSRELSEYIMPRLRCCAGFETKYTLGSHFAVDNRAEFTAIDSVWFRLLRYGIQQLNPPHRHERLDGCASEIRALCKPLKKFRFF
jgi:hypothetical protein